MSGRHRLHRRPRLGIRPAQRLLRRFVLAQRYTRPCPHHPEPAVPGHTSTSMEVR